MAQQQYFRSLRYRRVKSNQGAVIEIGRYGILNSLPVRSGGDEVMERAQMIEVEQFEDMSMDESGNHHTNHMRQ